MIKNSPATRETWVQSLDWEDALEKGKATHSRILAWTIPRTVSPRGSNRVRRDWAAFTCTLNLEDSAVFGELTKNHDFGLSIKGVSGSRLRHGQWKAMCLPCGNPRAIDPPCPHHMQTLQGLHEPSHWGRWPWSPELGHSPAPNPVSLLPESKPVCFTLWGFCPRIIDLSGDLGFSQACSFPILTGQTLWKVRPSGHVPTGTSGHTWFTPTCLAERETGFPGGTSGKEPACQCRSHKRRRLDPWVQKIPWRRKWQPTPGFLPGESHGQRSLAGYSPWGRKESDMTEWLTFHVTYCEIQPLLPFSGFY